MPSLPPLNCDGCRTCCLGDTIHLTANDNPARYKTRLLGDGSRVLKKGKDGNCVYLGKRGCQIQATKPEWCRQFDCRAYGGASRPIDAGLRASPKERSGCEVYDIEAASPDGGQPDIEAIRRRVFMHDRVISDDASRGDGHVRHHFRPRADAATISDDDRKEVAACGFEGRPVGTTHEMRSPADLNACAYGDRPIAKEHAGFDQRIIAQRHAHEAQDGCARGVGPEGQRLNLV